MGVAVQGKSPLADRVFIMLLAAEAGSTVERLAQQVRLPVTKLQGVLSAAREGRLARVPHADGDHRTLGEGQQGPAREVLTKHWMRLICKSLVKHQVVYEREVVSAMGTDECVAERMSALGSQLRALGIRLRQEGAGLASEWSLEAEDVELLQILISARWRVRS